MDIALLEEQYSELLVFYKNAIRSAESSIQNIKDELLASKEVRNPIMDDYSRLKTFDSVLAKCQKKGINDPGIEDIKSQINDIAGIRIICLYVDDIYKIAEMIKMAPGIAVIKVKDYVTNPKPSGYASLHLKTLVQISSVTEGTMIIPVEIQIRTELMETWSQTEHRVRYKSRTGPSPEIEKQLLQLAEQFKETDKLLVQIRNASGEK